MKDLTNIVLITILACTVQSPAAASAVIAPVSIQDSVAPLPNGFIAGNLINQSGLSIPYVSGVTDFDAYTQNATHPSPSIPNGSSLGGDLNVTYPISAGYDFGQTVNLERFALWNGIDDQRVGVFDILSSLDDTFLTLTSLGRFIAAEQDADSLAQIFDITDISTRYIIISATPFNINARSLNFGEFAFDGTLGTNAGNVPEPTSFALLASGLLGFGATRRKKKQA